MRERLPRRPIVKVFARHSFGCDSRGGSCDCPKWFRYSLNGKQVREPANTRSWTEAEERAVDRQRQLDGIADPVAAKPEQTTLTQAVQTYFTRKEGEGLSQSTLRKLRQQIGELESFLHSNGVFYPADITPQILIDYRSTWTWPSGLTRQKTQQNIKTFLRTCCYGEHRSRLEDSLKTIKRSGEDHQRTAPRPFSDDELTKMCAAVSEVFPDSRKAARMIAMIHFMASTGTAIRDTVQLERRHIESGCLEFRRQKMQTNDNPRVGKVVQRLAPELLSELKTVLNGNPKYIFWEGNNLPESEVGKWQTAFRGLMKAAGCYVEGTTTHRFRDTFVDRAFENGWSIERVAAAIGDKPLTVQTHYADMISKRQRDKMEALPVGSWYGK